jgi:hypothetical protein
MRMDAPTSWLNLELLAPLLEGGQPLLGVAGQVNVHASSHTCNTWLYQIRRPLGLAFVIYFWWLGNLLLFYI